MRRRARKMTPEGYVKTAVLDVLAVERIWHRRMNTGAHVVEATETTARRFIAFGSPGMGDILATPMICRNTVVQLVVLWIETKKAKGKQRDAQIEFQAEAEAAGHYYLLANSSDDVLAWLDDHCEMRKARKARRV